jgi:hypothetical protein
VLEVWRQGREFSHGAWHDPPPRTVGRFMRDDTKELTLLIQSRFPIIVVETPEEPRFMTLVERSMRSSTSAARRRTACSSSSTRSRTSTTPSSCG